jgi:HK97 family phage portal protein
VEQKSPISRPAYTIFNQPAAAIDVIHLRRYPQTGSAMGLSPLDIHAELFGVAQAARKYAAQWFGEGGVPKALLVNDQPIDETIAGIAKERWRSGGRGREVRTLGSGWKYEKVQSTPGDSELVETWNRVGLEVAQAFRVPPEMIGVAQQGSSVTYANREQRAVDFLTFTVEPWLTIFEDFWFEALPRPRFAKFNTGNLLRSDLMTRYKAHDIAIRMGLVTVNERRALEDLEPVDGGDRTLWPPYATSAQQIE